MSGRLELSVAVDDVVLGETMYNRLRRMPGYCSGRILWKKSWEKSQRNRGVFNRWSHVTPTIWKKFVRFVQEESQTGLYQNCLFKRHDKKHPTVLENTMQSQEIFEAPTYYCSSAADDGRYQLAPTTEW